MVLFPDNSSCLAKKYCTESLFDSLAEKTTPSGFTFRQALQSGIHNPDSSIGIYAGDAESYDIFSPIFEPIIHEYHCTGSDTLQTHRLEALDHDVCSLNTDNILSTRIRAARNIDGFPFTPHISAAERLQLEDIFRSALPKLQYQFGGDYFSYAEISNKERKELQQRKLAFPRGDRFQDAAGMNRDYPLGRGIYLSDDKRVRIWLNEEDHLRVICQDATADIAGIFTLFCRVHDTMIRSIRFSHSQRYGYLTACPTNIGTSMRAGVHIKLQSLKNRPKSLLELATANNLQIRGSEGEKTSVKDGIFDLSNSRRFGLDELEIIETLTRGIDSILLAEKSFRT